ncbi:MAG TPA: EF-hand domain-containing protein [Burkholderiaceae bacterium]|nr:EF-hand domain-containing protein [Burkholderiaceae bacterium]
MANAEQPLLAAVDAAFVKADPDGDGSISWDEAQRFGISKAAFDRGDTEKDGKLDKAEFLTALRAQFDAADPDGDSALDRKEASKAGVLGAKSFEAVDIDKDGTIDFVEFVMALTVPKAM